MILQLADLVARPVGMSVLRLDQPNRAFDTLKAKFFSKDGRENTGKGYADNGLKWHNMVSATALSTSI
ncbi:hypothetical protein DN062_16065 [Nitrincola tibetensis]|uniref:Uncharacterized protein n=1 Tax=Nitrincola tibetensis TaxID=2219697 RepID=A0A364NJ43_9GAMM|nr:hypothetical protein DN062_16065 [Nitrincola tibetensis]